MVDDVSSPIAVDVHFECLRPAAFRDCHRDVDNDLLLGDLVASFQFFRVELVRRATSRVEGKLAPHLDVLGAFAAGKQQVQVAVALQLERLRRQRVIFLQSSATRPLETLSPTKPTLNPKPLNPPATIANLVSLLHPLNLRAQIRWPLSRRLRAPPRPRPRSHRYRPRREMRRSIGGLQEACTSPPQRRSRHGDRSGGDNQRTRCSPSNKIFQCSSRSYNLHTHKKDCSCTMWHINDILVLPLVVESLEFEP